jgi:hypothetical protein
MCRNDRNNAEQNGRWIGREKRGKFFGIGKVDLVAQSIRKYKKTREQEDKQNAYKP